MLHVVNGQATNVPIEGDRLYWFDFFMEGPLGVPWEDRAEWLEVQFGVRRTDFLRGKDGALAALGTFRDHDEIVLWFEGDLFCLMNMAFALDWFAGQQLSDVRIAAVCPAEERLGPMGEHRLRELFEGRLPLGADALHLGRRVWQWLLGGAEPTDFRAWPALERTIQLRRRQQEGEIQSTILGLLTHEPRKLGLVFRDFYATELGYTMGMGDAQFAWYVVGLQPRISISPAVSGPPFDGCGKWELALAS